MATEPRQNGATKSIVQAAPTMPAQPEYTRELIDTIKRTVAKDATDAELRMFLHAAQRYGLDPLAREIVFWKDKHGRPNIVTTRDGYFRAAMRDPDYEGCISDVVREGDVFEVDASTFRVTHKYGQKRGKIIGAWAIAYHKQRKPMYAFADYEEYARANGNSPAWQQYPSAMIRKVAEVFVLRRQFNITGLVAQEELPVLAAEAAAEPVMEAQPVVEADVQPVQTAKAAPAPATSLRDEVKAVYHKAKLQGMSDDDIRAALQEATGRNTLRGWRPTAEELTAWRKALQARQAAQEAPAGSQSALEQAINAWGVALAAADLTMAAGNEFLLRLYAAEGGQADSVLQLPPAWIMQQVEWLRQHGGDTLLDRLEAMRAEEEMAEADEAEAQATLF